MFLSISLPLSRNLTPSLSYHIVRKWIAKVTDFLSFCPFGIIMFLFLTFGISMYQKRILPYFIIPYLFTPSWFPFGVFQSVRLSISTPLSPLLLSFFHWACGPFPQAQLYWAGRTMGWMADEQGGIEFERDAVVFRKRSHFLNNSACEYTFFIVLRSSHENWHSPLQQRKTTSAWGVFYRRYET